MRFSVMRPGERKRPTGALQLIGVSAVTIAALVLAAFLAGRSSSANPAASEFNGEDIQYDAAFNKLETTRLEAGGGQLLVGIAPGELRLSKADILEWVARSAKAVITYYGRFPVPSTRILIVPVEGDDVEDGEAHADKGGAIRVLVGRDAARAALDNDWVMVHEMVHLAFPDLDEKHDWLSEGLATYVEAVARAQSDDLTEQQIWEAFVKSMPLGLPGEGDKGLDRAQGRDRVYWGGAAFCLLADIEIRKRTGNRLSLQHALRTVLRSGGTLEDEWPIHKALAAADASTGLTVLSDLYETMRAKPVTPDLDGLWRDLGVTIQKNSVSSSVSFNDNAPLAAVRRAITTAPGSPQTVWNVWNESGRAPQETARP